MEEDNKLNEPQADYHTKANETPPPEGYVTVEEFKAEAKKYISSEEFWEKVEEKGNGFVKKMKQSRFPWGI